MKRLPKERFTDEITISPNAPVTTITTAITKACHVLNGVIQKSA